MTASASLEFEANVHLLRLYNTDQSMFKLDGRHFKSANGKDYLDSLLAQADSGMVRVSLDADVRQSEADNRIAVVESRVELVRQDLGRQNNRLYVVVCRAAEDGDEAINQRFVPLFFIFICFLIRFSRLVPINLSS